MLFKLNNKFHCLDSIKNQKSNIKGKRPQADLEPLDSDLSTHRHSQTLRSTEADEDRRRHHDDGESGCIKTTLLYIRGRDGKLISESQNKIERNRAN